MRRRLSESDESDCIESHTPDPPPAGHDDKRRTFTSAKFDVSTHSETLDRRKIEKGHSPARSISNAWKPSPAPSEGDPKSKTVLTSEPVEVDSMPGRRGWRHLRAKSPWSCTLLTLSFTVVAIVLLLSITHSFATRQLDPKGCQMYYSQPIYTRFADFDTEHTRFASKYSLYLYREGGFDEDPKARRPRNMRGALR